MSLVNFSLEGRTAIVTGGSRGIGRAISLAYAEAGAAIVLAARKADSLEATRKDVEAAGAKCLTVETNVRDHAALENLVKRTVEEFGKVDILVNNAGANPTADPLLGIDEKVWDVIMNTNLSAAFFLSKLCAEDMMKRRSGAIINVSSIDGGKPAQRMGPYSIAKAGMNMMTRSMGLEWGKYGIRVNAIAPGLIQTGLTEIVWKDDSIREHYEKNVPLRRMGVPDDIAGAALFLASDASSFITGQILGIDGGAPDVGIDFFEDED